MKKIRDTLWLLLRLGLAVAVMVWLLRKMGLEHMGQTLRGTAGHWPWLLAAFLVCIPPLFLCIVRWKLILDAQEMKLPWARVSSIFFIGTFFNSFMIGPTGGDLVKAYYTARETHHKKTEAVTSIFIDRIIGMIVLALIVSVMILVRWNFYMEHPQTRVTALVALAVCGGIVAGGILAFSVHLFETFPFLKRWTLHPVFGKAFGLVEKVYNAFYVCRAQPRLLLKIAGYSLVLQVLFVVSTFFVGRALDLDRPFLDYLSLAPLVGLISAIPVTPGGLGIREGASIHLWAIMGVPSGKAFLLAFLPYLFLVLWGLPGGVLFLFHRSGTGMPLRKELEEASAEPAEDA
jgi:uncharacterized membrane protein YbhN (UPF0104 family)